MPCCKGVARQRWGRFLRRRLLRSCANGIRLRKGTKPLCDGGVLRLLGENVDRQPGLVLLDGIAVLWLVALPSLFQDFLECSD